MMSNDHAITNEQSRRLVQAAVDARARAYAPYSHFQVGAAILTEDDQVITGCNVENASFGLTICAERVACSASVAQGCRRFRAIAIATDRGDAPCGACRQFLAEFAPDLTILLVASGSPDEPHITSLTTLLPGQFRLNDEA